MWSDLSGMNLVTLLIIFLLGSLISLPMTKMKFVKNIPRPVVLIFIGILLAGSTNIATGDSWFGMPDGFGSILNPGHEDNKSMFTILSSSFIGILMFSAGFGLNPRELFKMGPTPILMGFIPCMIEGVVAGSVLFLFGNVVFTDGPGFNYSFALAAGFAIASAAPGIVIPILLRFKKEKWSQKSGMLDSIVTGASLDNVTAIAFFIIFFNLGIQIESNAIGGEIASSTPMWELIVLQTPWLFIFSGLVGVMCGFIVWGIKLSIDQIKINDSKKENIIKKCLFTFVVIVFAVGLFALSNQTKVWNTGPDVGRALPYIEFEFYLSMMAIGLVVSYFWRNKENKSKKIIAKEKVEIEGIEKSVSLVWTFIGMPFVFIYAGTNVDLRALWDLKLFAAILIIALGLMGRQSGIIISTYPKRFSWKERFFGGTALIPKGTSTIGIIVLMQTYEQLMPPEVWEIIATGIFPWLLLVSSISIVFTIPIAIKAVEFAAPRLLVPPENMEHIKKNNPSSKKPPK